MFDRDITGFTPSRPNVARWDFYWFIDEFFIVSAAHRPRPLRNSCFHTLMEDNGCDTCT